MDLRSVATYLLMKDMNGGETHAYMNKTLGADCIGYSIVTKYLREKSFSKSMIDSDFEPKIKQKNVIDDAILEALEECSFSSLRQIAKRILIPMSMVRCHLVNSLAYRVRNIRWVPHSLSSSPKQSRAEVRQELI
jgi:hypothetical protein